ncbi:YihY/virulence factor BrkB family protein [Runella aurantiaca]|uniref:YihY/virulence factor BrkB family protein n=1 Tax=Runella aurantiaca TaxID=2282308 RepID=A0A369I3V3_9BACT|nr:YihY/virulence factor BrkB family protein [Runella aurantiaca]RDB04481.1 YihY/virulence factor BrkB family protein [Runella aurantiaca]
MLQHWSDSKYRQLRKTYAFLHRKRFFSNGVSLADIGTLLIEKILLYDIDQRATAVAYNFTLAVFPAILFLFTLIPYFPIANMESQIMNFMYDAMPKSLYEFAAATIYDIISRKQGGILSFGFVFALLTATNGMGALMTAFNMVDHTSENRGFFKAKGIALLLTVLLSTVLFLAVLVIIVGGFLVDWLHQTILFGDNLTVFLLDALRYLVMFFAFTVAVAIIYRFAPKVRHGWRFFNLGAIIASMLIILVTYGFSFYLSRFSSYNKLYGSIGTIIAMMIWFYLVALLLIFGFELNTSIWRAKHIGRGAETKK